MARSCGSCTLCCTVQGVKEGMPGLPEGKLPNTPCPHLNPKDKACGGCSIYENRPSECSGYRCLWIDGLGKLQDRPDRLGVLFEYHDQEDPTHPYVAIRTIKRGREQHPRVKALARKLREGGHLVLTAHPEDVQGWVTYLRVQGGVAPARPRE